GLSRLSSDAVRALSVASVAGPEFEIGVIANVIDEDPGVVRSLLDEAVAARVVTEKRRLVGRYAFSHALVREALSDEMGPVARADLHGRLGEAIEAVAGANLDLHLAELAFHFLNGRPEDRTKAVEYSRRAGDRARGQLLYADAL